MKHATFATILASAALLLVGAGCEKEKQVRSFEECVAAGNPIMESYPRQCRAHGETFVEIVPEVPKPKPEPEQESPAKAGIGEPFTLQSGQSREVDGAIRLTLLEILDSRCKPGTQCIWAGELSARFKLESLENAFVSREFSLGTMNNQSSEVSGFKFSLKGATETSATVVVTR